MMRILGLIGGLAVGAILLGIAMLILFAMWVSKTWGKGT